MPQLNLLREPTASILTLGVGMPITAGSGRWHLSLTMSDYDGRPCGDGVWSIPRSSEHADIGLVLKDAYDTWFNSDWWKVTDAVDRSIRQRLR